MLDEAAGLLGEILDIEYGHFWVLLGIVLVILESLGAALAFASLGAGAVITGIVAYFGLLSLSGLLAVFGGASLLVFLLSRPLANRITSAGPAARTNVDGMVGRCAVVIREIGGRSKPGYVKLAGDEWRALPVGDEGIPAGCEVEIDRVEGSTLFVKPKSQNVNEEDTE